MRIAMVFQREVINHIVPKARPDLIHCNDWMTALIPAMAMHLNYLMGLLWVPWGLALWGIHLLRPVPVRAASCAAREISPTVIPASRRYLRACASLPFFMARR
jgi:hypothetical protein